MGEKLFLSWFKTWGNAHYLNKVVESQASQLNIESDPLDVVALRHSELHSFSCIQVENLGEI